MASVLLIGGGLTTLQNAEVCTGLPFDVVLLLIVYALYIGFTQEVYVGDSVRKRLKRVEEKHRFSVAIEKAAD